MLSPWRLNSLNRVPVSKTEHCVLPELLGLLVVLAFTSSISLGQDIARVGSAWTVVQADLTCLDILFEEVPACLDMSQLVSRPILLSKRDGIG